MQSSNRQKIDSDASLPRDRCTAIDLFFAVNLALGFGVWLSANRAVYFTLVPDERIGEFVFFVAVLLTGISALWMFVRCRAIPLRVLVAVEIALLMHFAGGWVHFGGLRLYGHVFGGIRFDKVVHAAAAFAAGTVLMELGRQWRLPGGWFGRGLVALAALGVGAGVESYEYLVTQTMPALTTARFEDSLRDLIADLAGVMWWVAMGGRHALFFGRARKEQGCTSGV